METVTGCRERILETVILGDIADKRSDVCNIGIDCITYFDIVGQ